MSYVCQITFYCSVLLHSCSLHSPTQVLTSRQLKCTFNKDSHGSTCKSTFESAKNLFQESFPYSYFLQQLQCHVSKKHISGMLNLSAVIAFIFHSHVQLFHLIILFIFVLVFFLLLCRYILLLFVFQCLKELFLVQ